MGERGDWGREHVLDPVMLSRVAAGRFGRALDVGCGEGRFCRMLKAAGVAATGIDPTRQLLEVARQRDPTGDYRSGNAEQLEFEAASFDLVVSYLTLIDIVDFRTAINEMARVLKPGGSLLIANLTGFTSASCRSGVGERCRRAPSSLSRRSLPRRISILVRMGGNTHPELAPAACRLHDGLARKRLATDVFRGARTCIRRRRPSGTGSAGALVRRDGMAASFRRVTSGPRPVPPQRLQRQPFADRAERVAFDEAGRRHRLPDRIADMGELHRTTGQEDSVDILRPKPAPA